MGEEKNMNQFVRYSMIIIFWNVFWLSPVLAGDIILPQGDRSLQESDAVEKNREEIRKSRLKQQGQGENYRIEGELQGGSEGPKTHPTVGHDRQDTGIEDPSVNPGQSAGLNT